MDIEMGKLSGKWKMEGMCSRDKGRQQEGV